MAQKNENNDRSKITPVVIGIITAIFAGGYAALYWWVYQETVYEGRPAPILLIFTIIPILVILSVVAVVRMRMKEIDDGELDEAKKY